jgi:hypothetical protein
MYTRLSAYQLAILHGIYPEPHPPCNGIAPTAWVYGGSIFEWGEQGSEDIALFHCWCGKYGFVSRSKIEDIIDPKCTMRPWVKEQRQ